MNIRLNGVLSGAVTPPPSKSQAHRLLICAALGEYPCTIACNALNDDLVATMNCLNALGAKIEYKDSAFTVVPVVPVKNATLDCGESGSTLRFLISVAAVMGADATFTGHGKLPYRPNGDLCAALAENGVAFERHSADAELPMTCKGVLSGGSFKLPGNISSQYLTGLLFALPLAMQDSTIEVVGGLNSASYIAMTIDALEKAGIYIEQSGNIFRIPSKQKYALLDELTVESDWSSAAFWLVAGVVGNNPITVKGLNPKSLQGDRNIIAHLCKMGAYIENTPDGYVAMPSQLFGAEIDCKDTPDLLPILSVAAAAANGKTTFFNVGRLRYKESDRLAAMQEALAACGIQSEIGDDTFSVYGGTVTPRSAVDSFGDHRIAMSAAIMATLSTEPLIIKGAECVAKSYPRFFDDFMALGGKKY